MTHMKSFIALTVTVFAGLFPQSGYTTPISKTSTSVGGIPGGIIDADLGQNQSGVQVTGSMTITPLGIVWTLEASAPVATGSWVVNCDTTTKYFPTITGSQPNDDVINSTPSTTSINLKKRTFYCGYKTSAHAANIAKEVNAKVNYALSVNGSLIVGTVSSTCRRATKTTVNFTC